MKVAVYPGSFDPITFGHLDVLGRAAEVFDRIIVGVLENPRKSPLLPVDQRIEIINAARDEHCAGAAARIAVEAFTGLTVEFCRARAPSSSSAAFARSATSRPSSSSATPTAILPRKSTPCSS